MRTSSLIVVASSALVVTLALAPPLRGQQAVPVPGAQGSAAPAPPPTGVIFGQVVDADSGRPVSGAVVMAVTRGAALAAAGVAPSGPMDQRRAFSNDDGRFVLRNLANGSYAVSVTAPGYLTGMAGRTRPEGPERPVELDDANRVANATVKIWKFAAIAGTVVDEAGAPAIGIPVRALRRQWMGGRRVLAGAAGYFVTDDRGVFRISGLAPGEYVVVVPTTVTNVPTSTNEAYGAAMMSGNPEVMRQFSGTGVFPGTGITVGDQQVQMMGERGDAASIVIDGGQILSYQTLYYPSAVLPSQATAITLASGETRTGVDLQLKLTRMLTVSGSVSGPDAQVGSLGVRLVPADTDLFSDSGLETAMTLTDTAGRFTLLGVPPGPYLMKTARIPRPAVGAIADRVVTTITAGGGGVVTMSSGGPPAPAPITEPTLWAQASITTSDRNLTGVALTLREGFRISGRVEFDGAAPRPTPERLALMSLLVSEARGRSGQAGPGAQRLNPQGQFRSGQYIPGFYTVTTSPPGPPWVLQSISADGRDLLLESLDLTMADVGDVVITYADRSTELSGVVQDGSRPSADAAVFVCPANVDAWIAGGMSARRSRTATANATGAYRIADLPPGDYIVVAVARDRAPDFQNPAIIRGLASGASRVTLAVGDRKSQNVTLGRSR
jgi:hypothetical protein